MADVDEWLKKISWEKPLKQTSIPLQTEQKSQGTESSRLQ